MPDPNDADFEGQVQAEEDLDEPRSFARGDAVLAAADDARPADFEAESLADDEESDALEAQLDEAVGETFPASDPVAISRRSD